MKVLMVKNITREGPGLLEGVLKQHNIAYDLVDLHRGEKFPDPRGYKAVFVFGGPDSANDTTEKMTEELRRVKETIEAGIPYLGSCLGMQVLVKANGGTVYKNQVPEVGWRPPGRDWKFFEIELTEEGKKDPLFANLKPPLRIFHLHGETVFLTDSMKLLATGELCKNQVVKIGENAYGLQGHFELNEEMFKKWAAEDPDLQKLPQQELYRDYLTVRVGYESNGKILLTNFLRTAKLVSD